MAANQGASRVDSETPSDDDERSEGSEGEAVPGARARPARGLRRGAHSPHLCDRSQPRVGVSLPCAMPLNPPAQLIRAAARGPRNSTELQLENCLIAARQEVLREEREMAPGLMAQADVSSDGVLCRTRPCCTLPATPSVLLPRAASHGRCWTGR
jgi:hypothetical protein